MTAPSLPEVGGIFDWSWATAAADLPEIKRSMVLRRSLAASLGAVAAKRGSVPWRSSRAESRRLFTRKRIERNSGTMDLKFDPDGWNHGENRGGRGRALSASGVKHDDIVLSRVA